MTDNKTPLRPIRIEEDLWAEFGRLVGVRNRSQVIRDFIRWFVRERGAQLPARGEAGDSGPDRDPALRSILVTARNDLAHSTPLAMPVSSDETQALLPRELQIFFLAADGLSDAEIAAVLKVAPRTAKTHIRKVAEKVRAAGRAKIYVPEDQLRHWPADATSSGSPASD